ncbi:hypothetical protein ABIF50_003732 [Bradyrhizobium diazoefficiens]
MEPAIAGCVACKIEGGSMGAKKSPKKSPRLISPSGIITLLTHAMMGAAIGLAFGLVLILSNPAVANLLNHGGDSAAAVFVVTLVTTFAIGAMLTGIVFIIAEDKEF